MRRVKKLNEILEECIEAGIAGRRSLKQSLALYPAQAEELEPLLRTALSISDSFQSYTPPAAVEQRVRSRFLADAAARRNLRHLEGSFENRGWLAGLFRKPIFGGFAAAAAVAIAVVAITAGSIDLGGSEGDPLGGTVVLDLREQVDSVNDKIDSSGQYESADLEELSRLFTLLKSSSDEDIQASAGELEAILPDTLHLLASASGDAPGIAEDQAVIDAIDTSVRDIAAIAGVELPGPAVPDDSPTPTPTNSAEPTDTPAGPTDTPAEPTDTPVEPTPAPGGDETTAAPTATPPPVPTATAEDRAPPGFLP